MLKNNIQINVTNLIYAFRYLDYLRWVIIKTGYTKLSNTKTIILLF